MSRVVVLDSGPLGLATNPGGRPEAVACARWVRGLMAGGTRVVVSEVSDYEVRRELLRAGKTRSVARLDALAASTEYLPLTTAVMRRAAEFWADIRRAGRPTAGAEALDGDVTLAAQAESLGGEVVVATTNLPHLSLFVTAALWTDII